MYVSSVNLVKPLIHSRHATAPEHAPHHLGCCFVLFGHICSDLPAIQPRSGLDQGSSWLHRPTLLPVPKTENARNQAETRSSAVDATQQPTALLEACSNCSLLGKRHTQSYMPHPLKAQVTSNHQSGQKGPWVSAGWGLQSVIWNMGQKGRVSGDSHSRGQELLVLWQPGKHVGGRPLAGDHKGGVEAAEHGQHLLQVQVVTGHAEDVDALQ